jgi:hypothetical protein
LQLIAKEFNKSLLEWYELWGCTAEFAWTYDRQGRKMLDIAAVDLAVYRRAAPDGETLGAMLDRLDP